MGKRNPAVPAENAVSVAVKKQYKSLEEMAYDQATLLDEAQNQAQYALDKIVGFPEDCPQESRDELNRGWLKKWKSLEGNSGTTYAKVDGTYREITPDNADQYAKAEKCHITLDVALSYSTHEFGRLNETHDSIYKGLIKDFRDKSSTYCSTCYKRLVAEAKNILSGKKPRERGATKTITERLTAFREAIVGSCKSANTRGDPTANIDKLNVAWDAFFKVWDK